MKVRILLFTVIVVFTGAIAVVGQTATAMAPSGSAMAAAVDNPGEFVPVTKFDPARDGAADIQAAVNEATRTHKRVLVDVGGEWCIWCHRMDDFLTEHPSLLKLRDDNFVMVKVNFSEENKNEALIAKYGTVNGYPHIFVLEGDGNFLHSQDTGLLEDGKKSYNLAKYTAFLKTWSPKPNNNRRIRHRRNVRARRH